MVSRTYYIHTGEDGCRMVSVGVTYFIGGSRRAAPGSSAMARQGELEMT